jgi:hypothetical protein
METVDAISIAQIMSAVEKRSLPPAIASPPYLLTLHAHHLLQSGHYLHQVRLVGHSLLNGVVGSWH